MFPCARSTYTFSYSGENIPTTSEYKFTTNGFTEVLHKMGTFLIRPLIFEANQATRLHSGNWRPGKDYNALSTKEKAWKIVKMSTLFTVVLPLIALILSALGFLLTSVASLSKPDVFLLKNPKSKNDDLKLKKATTFRLMTYNMALGPKFMNNEGNVRSSSQRAAELGNWLSTLENAPDMICAQECFDIQATQILCGYLKDYPYIVYGVAPNRFGVNSGLLIASKLPITKIDYKRFSNLTGEDAWSNKGMLGVTVCQETQEFTVINTHLQARNGEKYENIRLDEVQELKSFAESISQGRTGFIAGDFNLSHFHDSGEPRKTLRQAEEKLGDKFVNLFYQDHSRKGENEAKTSTGSWYDKSLWGNSNWQKKTVEGCVVDHIYSYKVPLQNFTFQTSIEVSEINKESGQSDHLPLTVELKI